MIKILLADANNLFRKALSLLISSDERFQLVYETASGSEVIRFLGRESIDLVILDACLLDLSSMDFIQRIRARHPALPVMILSMQENLSSVKKWLEAGATGYLSKNCEPQLLFDAITKVAAGGRYLPANIAEQIVFSNLTNGQQKLPHEHLTKRELQIFQMLNLGMKLNDIGNALSISHKTVSTHKARLMKKMGIDNNAALVAYAIQHQLSDCPDKNAVFNLHKISL